ncbi:MAG TPA: calcium-binding protein, partial [Roseimicrobium sp.]|nr:calcium-binding protein [Roseimicrobium sp.]
WSTTTDVLRFKEGITASDLVISRNGANLILAITGTADQITIEGFLAQNYINHAYGIDRIEFADGSTLSDATIQAVLSTGTDATETISGLESSDVMDAKSGDDAVLAAGGNDSVLGGAGNDGLYGQAGNDTLDGGVGNDLLQGSTGNDVYLFGRGDGQDIVRNHGYPGTVTDPSAYPYYAGAYVEGDYASTTDILRFKPGVAASDLVISRNGASLILAIAGTADQVTVEGFFASNYVNHAYGVDRIEFADGSTLSDTTIQAALSTGTDASETIYGLESGDLIDAKGGGDTVLAAGGNDTVLGGAGNDALYGQVGNDTLDGGTGNDFVQGGTGNDTYLFGRGDGQDTLRNYLYSSGVVDPNAYPFYAGAYLDGDWNTTTDVLRFKDGVTASDLAISRNGANLILAIKGTADQITIEGFLANNYVNHAYGIDRIEFADGSTLSDATIQAALSTGTDATETISGLESGDLIDAKGGGDTVLAAGGNDSVLGGAGNDALYGQVGNDTL